MTQADIVIIGGGPGGYEVAAEQAAQGKTVVLVERSLAGGTCLNRGCIPTKCLCASAAAASSTVHFADLGVNIGAVDVDYSRAALRMREVVDGLRTDVENALSRCTVVNAEAAITPQGTVIAADQEYSAPMVLIATGSAPAMLPIPGVDLALTSDDFLKLYMLPPSVVVIGGGVIGLEFASIMAAFGTEVTVIEYCKEVLPPFDREVAKRLRTMLSRRGIKFITGAAVTEIAAGENDRRAVTYTGKKGSESVTADAVLMAVGRRAVVPAGLAEAGIEVDRRGCIVADENMATTRHGIYAVGDCNGKLMLAHAATAQARVALGEKVDLRFVPSAVFTTPEAAMVGLTAEQAEAQGLNVVSAKAMFAGNGKARAMGEADGIVKVLADASDGKLLGVHIVGPHAADLISEAVTALRAGFSVMQAGTETVHGHPTLSEVLAGAYAAAAQKIRQ